MLSADNLVVHGLWIGENLSPLELLTLHSFTAHGHVFHLWSYSDLSAQVPAGVVCCDAREIIPEQDVFRRLYDDPVFGIGKGSYAGFSDMFRYKLLYEKGGWWVDMDIYCVQPLQFSTPYYFRAHHDLPAISNVMKCPAGSAVMRDAYEQTRKYCKPETKEWLIYNKLFNESIVRHQLQEFIFSGQANRDWWDETALFIFSDKPIPPTYYFIHWQNEMWRQEKVNKHKIPAGSTLAKCLTQYDLPVYHPSPAEIRIKTAAPVMLAFFVGFLLFYAGWEIYWYKKVGLSFVKWHTHLLFPVYVFGLIGLGWRLLKNRIRIVKKNYREGLLLISALFFAIWTLETALLVTGWNKTRYEKEGGFYFSPLLRTSENRHHTWLAQGSVHYLKTGEYNYIRHTNSEGYADVEWSLPKPQDTTTRILCMGDSFTEGDGAPQDSSYPALLQQLLGSKVTVMNAGVCGSDPFFNFVGYRENLHKYKPKFILQTLSTHDILSDYALRGGMERFTKDNVVFRVSPPCWESLYAMSYVFRLFLSAEQLNLLTGIPQPNDKSEAEMTKDFFGLFKRYHQEAKIQGAELVIILLPMKSEVENGKYDFPLPVSPDIPRINLLQAYQSEGINAQKFQPYYWHIDAHHNASGYRIMALSIARALEQAYGISSLPPVQPSP